jgi:hypothetical protein
MVFMEYFCGFSLFISITFFRKNYIFDIIKSLQTVFRFYVYFCGTYNQYLVKALLKKISPCLPVLSTVRPLSASPKCVPDP